MGRRQLRNIIVPLDFSSKAIKSLQYAITLAQVMNAKLWIMHVYRLIMPYNQQLQRGISLKESIEQSRLDEFEKLQAKLLINSGVDFDFLLEIGFATRVIESYIKSNDIDLIILSYGGDGNQPFGSTTSGLLRNSNLPVILVPPQANPGPIKKIAFPKEKKHHPKDHESLWPLKFLADAFDASLDMFQPRHISSTGTGDEVTFSPNKNDTGLSHYENGIFNYLKENNVDLMGITKRRHHVYPRLLDESQRRNTTLHSKVPLLILSR